MIHNLKNADCPEIDWENLLARPTPMGVTCGFVGRRVERLIDPLGKTLEHFRSPKQIGTITNACHEVMSEGAKLVIVEVAAKVIAESSESEALEMYSRRWKGHPELIWPTGGYWYEVHAD